MRDVVETGSAPLHTQALLVGRPVAAGDGRDANAAGRGSIGGRITFSGRNVATGRGAIIGGDGTGPAGRDPVAGRSPAAVRDAIGDLAADPAVGAHALDLPQREPPVHPRLVHE